jgi:ribosome-associated protein YbcJ (S4-like RNA binding protein)
MLLKSKIQETVNALDDEIEIDDLLERFVILDKITEAEKQIKDGQIYTNDEIENEIKEWFK